MLNDDICKCEGSAGIVLFSFVYFREDMPDNGRTAETCSLIMRRRVFTINSQLCLAAFIC
jgi:hypothetical protein